MFDKDLLEEEEEEPSERAKDRVQALRKIEATRFRGLTATKSLPSVIPIGTPDISQLGPINGRTLEPRGKDVRHLDILTKYDRDHLKNEFHTAQIHQQRRAQEMQKLARAGQEVLNL
jgi:hypothetical protein